MRRFVREQGWPYPYLHDESQEVARALGAEVTPHVFVLDGEQRLVYRGAPDADHQDPSQGAAWLPGALDAVLDGRRSPSPRPGARLQRQVEGVTAAARTPRAPATPGTRAAEPASPTRPGIHAPCRPGVRPHAG